jgi:prevent-host-death family protein
MLTVSVSEAKSKLSAILERVQHGETVLILRRGRPVARLEPVRATSDVTDEARTARLEQSGVIRRASAPADASLLDGPAPSLTAEVGLLSAVIEDREQGR